MKVGVYILHYKDDEMTERCVEAFTNMLDGSTDHSMIYVIDNGSPTPYDPKWLHVQVLRLDENIAVVEAWNAGMRTYPADVYFVANNDVFPEQGCIDKLLAALEDPTVGIVAPGTDDTGVGFMTVAYPNTLPDVDMNHVDGALWGWRQDLINAIGYPDCEGHTHQMCWASNQDYCYRARLAGYRVVCVRQAFVHHEHKPSYDRNAAYTAGVKWLMQKWGDKAPQVWA